MVWRRFGIINWLRRRLNTRFDNRLEDFIHSLYGIEGFKEMMEDIGRGKLMRLQIGIITELLVFKSTIVSKSIPDAKKIDSKRARMIRRSKYKQYFGNVSPGLDEEETIRQSYTNLYHRFENFRTELISCVNIRLAQISGRSIDIEAYLKERYKFKIDDIKKYPDRIRRINWISTCVKHYGGYPRKEYPPAEYVHADPAQKIVVPQKTLDNDIDFVLQFVARIFKAVMLGAICERLEHVFAHYDQKNKQALLPSVVMVNTLAVAFFNSFNADADDAYIKNWERFIDHYSTKNA